MVTIKQIRRDMGVSQEQMASLLGISQSYLGMLEGGHRVITQKIYQRLFEIRDQYLEAQIVARDRYQPDLTSIKNNLRSKLENAIRQQQHEMDNLIYKVKKMTEENEKAVDFIDFIAEKLADTSLSELDRSKYYTLHLQTQQVIEETCEESRAYMQWRIDSLQVAIEKGKEMLARYSQ